MRAVLARPAVCRILLPCLLALFCGTATAQQAAPSAAVGNEGWRIQTHGDGVTRHGDPSAAVGNEGWRISGRVVDAKTGQPLARCTVGIQSVRNGSPSRSLVTQSGGAFLFTGLQPGKYALSAAKRGYLTQSYQQHEQFSTAIAVGPGQNTDNLLFRVMPQAIFYGLITDEAGEPIRGAEVRLYEDRNQDGMRSTRLRSNTVTDDRGMYELANIDPANYFLSVSAQPWYANGQALLGQTQNGPARAEPQLADFAYPTTYYPNATDSDDATPIPIKGGERIQANMVLTAQRAMHFRIPAPKTRSGGFPFSVTQSVFGESVPFNAGIFGDGDGTVEVTGLLPGRYEVTVGNGSDRSPERTTFTADVAEGATELIPENSSDEVNVSGHVVAAGGNVASGGISLVGAHPRRNYYASLNQAGEFSMHVIPGEYEVIGQIPRFYLASVSSTNAPVKGRMLQVKSGASPQLTIVAATGYGQIEGLAARDGHPLSGAMILLAPEDPGDNQILFRRDQSDSDGTFLLFNIIPGRYRLLAIDDGWEVNWADPHILARYLKKSIPIVVAAHDQLTQSVEAQSP